MWRHRRCSAKPLGWEDIRDIYAIPVKSCCHHTLPSCSRFYSRRSTGPIAIYQTFSTCLFGPFSLFIRYDISVRNIWSSGVFIISAGIKLGSTVLRVRAAGHASRNFIHCGKVWRQVLYRGNNWTGLIRLLGKFSVSTTLSERCVNPDSSSFNFQTAIE